MIFNPQNFVSNVLNTEGAKEPKRARMSPPKPLFSDFKVCEAVAQTKKRITLIESEYGALDQRSFKKTKFEKFEKRFHSLIVYWKLVFVGKIGCGIFCARIKPYECSRGKSCLQLRSFLYQKPFWRNNPPYYPTSLRRVQITPKTSTNITRYLYSRGPVRQVFSQRASVFVKRNFFSTFFLDRNLKVKNLNWSVI